MVSSESTDQPPMRDPESQEPKAPQAPFCPLPSLEGERRKEQDRRSLERSGKYDRRKNRCGHCLHFHAEAGLCRFHQMSVTLETFACPQFDAFAGEEPR